MKKVVAFSLLAILFTSQVGYYFVYTIHQHIIKEEMERGLMAHIPESSLEVIIAEKVADKMVWEEKNKEFSLEGILYDVARIEKKDGKTFLYCINDKNEKQLLDNLVKAVNKNNDNKQGRNNIKPLLLDLVCMSEEEEPGSFSVPSAYSNFNVTLVSSFEEINSPPPKA
ncbi:MAG TPA: hypothetical protein VFU29_17570 [Chitinophagaceae bacterium]|nr:hypothetical protein [Chitinophagaceae bacterium]